MGTRRILCYPDPVLEAENKPVKSFDQGFVSLIEDLFKTSWKAPGLGLAAPQVGVNLSVAVVDLSVGKEEDKKIVLANPKIVHTSGSDTMEEGCLSFPGLFVRIVRPKSLKVKAQDISGDSFEIEAEGLLAQAICHEVDHLNGKLIKDHLKGLKRQMFMRRVRKMSAKRG